MAKQLGRHAIINVSVKVNLPPLAILLPSILLITSLLLLLFFSFEMVSVHSFPLTENGLEVEFARSNRRPPFIDLFRDVIKRISVHRTSRSSSLDYYFHLKGGFCILFVISLLISLWAVQIEQGTPWRFVLAWPLDGAIFIIIISIVSIIVPIAI